MVETTVAARGVKDADVLRALRTIPRHLFVPAERRSQAYLDCALPVGSGQTISQPYVVGLMTEQAGARAGDRVLEVGTGSGYQTAVLAECGFCVYTIEIRSELAEQARRRLLKLGYRSVHFRLGDGRLGWPEAAPFDAILATAAPRRVPAALWRQLRPGGRLVIPVGEGDQVLKVLTATPHGLRERTLTSVRFVPMTGSS